MDKVRNLTLIEVILPKFESKTLSILKDIVLILSFAILTGICARIKVETLPVPITMQTFSVLLSGAILGAKKGALSQFSYLILGLIGVPWFSRGGGVIYIFTPTFGYLLGFILASYIVGFLCERGWDKKLETAILAMVIGNIILYIPGLLWLLKFVGVEKVLVVGFYPFIAGDLLKIFLAGFILSLAWKFIKISDEKR